MKGIIFNVVEEVVTELFDAETWDQLLADARLDGAYTALGNYEDHELESILAAGCQALGQDRPGLLRIVGRRSLEKLSDRVPDSLTNAPDPFTFIERVNSIIHPEVLKLYPGSMPPVFECERRDDRLLVNYRSSRDLGALAEGLLTAVGDRFDLTLDVVPIANEESAFSEGVVFSVTVSA